jgi:hypothetical protein
MALHKATVDYPIQQKKKKKKKTALVLRTLETSEK